MAQSADHLLGDLPPTRTFTPSVALPKLMEAVDQIQLLTRRSAMQDTLEDVTRLKLRILRRKFSSRLWMLRSLWYAEPIRLVMVGRWMSRIDKETTTELDALDAQLQRRTLEAAGGRGAITGSKLPDPNHNSCMVEEQVMFTVHRQVPRGGTDPKCQFKTPISSDDFGNDVTNTYKSLTTNSCWPPVGQCHSCGFDAHRRTGIVCIAYTKRCNICGTLGHIEKACKRRPNANAARSAKYIGVSPPTH